MKLFNATPTLKGKEAGTFIKRMNKTDELVKKFRNEYWDDCIKRAMGDKNKAYNFYVNLPDWHPNFKKNRGKKWISTRNTGTGRKQSLLKGLRKKGIKGYQECRELFGGLLRK